VSLVMLGRVSMSVVRAAPPRTCRMRIARPLLVVSIVVLVQPTDSVRIAVHRCRSALSMTVVRAARPKAQCSRSCLASSVGRCGRRSALETSIRQHATAVDAISCRLAVSPPHSAEATDRRGLHACPTSAALVAITITPHARAHAHPSPIVTRLQRSIYTYLLSPIFVQATPPRRAEQKRLTAAAAESLTATPSSLAAAACGGGLARHRPRLPRVRGRCTSRRASRSTSPTRSLTTPSHRPRRHHLAAPAPRSTAIL
jgi:hypothetical protein